MFTKNWNSMGLWELAAGCGAAVKLVPEGLSEWHAASRSSRTVRVGYLLQDQDQDRYVAGTLLGYRRNGKRESARNPWFKKNLVLNFYNLVCPLLGIKNKRLHCCSIALHYLHICRLGQQGSRISSLPPTSNLLYPGESVDEWKHGRSIDRTPHIV